MKIKSGAILIILFVVLAAAITYLFLKTKNKKNTVEKFPLVPGSTGKSVTMIQITLSVPTTGIYDAATKAAVLSQWGLDSVDAQDFIGHVDFEDDANDFFPMAFGDKGIYVRLVQALLGVNLTGTFDNPTLAALKSVTGKTSLVLADYRNLIFTTVGV